MATFLIFIIIIIILKFGFYFYLALICIDLIFSCSNFTTSLISVRCHINFLYVHLLFYLILDLLLFTLICHYLCINVYLLHFNWSNTTTNFNVIFSNCSICD